MDRLDRFETGYRLVLASVAAAGMELLRGYFDTFFPSGGAAFAVTLLVVLFIVFVLNALLESLVDRAPWLRRLIMGPDHIEGWWFDISRDPESGRPTHGMLVEIRRQDGEYRSTGVAFGADGSRLATTTSQDAVYSDRVLRYRYTSTYTRGRRNTDQGLVEMRFDSPAVSYAGAYYEIGDVLGFGLSGRRVDRRTVKRHRRFRDVEDKRAFIAGALARAAGSEGGSG